MILQVGSWNDLNWVIGLAILFGGALLINFLIGGNYRSFLLLCLATNGIVIMAGLLDEWTLILTLVINTINIIYSLKTNNNNGGT